MTQIKSVTVAGSTGVPGPFIIDALVNAGFEVQVLTRKDAISTTKNVKVVEVDYEDSEQLKKALTGQDAVVSALGPAAAQSQIHLIHASISAGVKRFIPSEFGSNLTNEHCKTLPCFGDKLKAQEILEAAANHKKDFTYTLIFNGPFLDWGISVFPFIINVGEKGGELFDGGDVPFSTSRLSTVGKAVAGTLKNFEETKNRVVFVHDGVVTQNQLVQRAQKLTGEEFNPKPVNSEALEQEAWGLFKDPGANPLSWIYSFIKVSIWGDCGGKFAKTDNALLGIPELKGPELENVLDEEILKAMKK